MIEDVKIRKSSKRRQRIIREKIKCVLLCFECILGTSLFFIILGWDDKNEEFVYQEKVPVEMETVLKEEVDITGFRGEIENLAREYNLSIEEWPEYMIEAGEKNTEIREFVKEYPWREEYSKEVDLLDLKEIDGVPLLMQWDKRWGYKEYAGELMGFSGCGPTCLSMVCVYLFQDSSFTPMYIAEFSEKMGYSTEGKGSTWTLISEGGKTLGIDVIEIPLEKERIMNNLEVGNPIICVLGPGEFTTTGHFIVLTGCVDDKIRLNDPNSQERSQKLWEYEELESSIRNLWVCR